MQPEFSRVTVEDDSVKQKSICTNCSKQLSAYTTSLLIEKELAHVCQEKRSPVYGPHIRPRRQKLY